MLSLIIPTYNEEGAAEEIIRRAAAALTKLNYEIIVVDDGSTDTTSAILKTIELPSLTIIRHSANRGNGAAIMTGVRAAHGDVIATIDADATYFPEDLPELIRAFETENADMVVGIRKALMDGPFFHRTARNMLRKWAEFWSGQKIPDINSGMRIIKKDLMLRYAYMYPRHFSLHIALMVCAGKDRKTIIYRPIRYGQRIGNSKLSPGLKGVGNFVKFLLLIPCAALGVGRILKS